MIIFIQFSYLNILQHHTIFERCLRAELDSALRALDVKLTAAHLTKLNEIFPGYKTIFDWNIVFLAIPFISNFDRFSDTNNI